MPPTDTKERILEAARELVLEKGFSGVGINEILLAVGVPKGSFYHWFASKEQFGVELIRHACEEALACKRRWLSKTETLPSAKDRILAIMESAASRVLDDDCKQSCLIAKLSAEVSSWSCPMREALAAGYRAIVDLYASTVSEGQAQGSIQKKLDPAEAAAVIHDVWTGAYLRASIQRSAEPLKAAISFLRSYL